MRDERRLGCARGWLFKEGLGCVPRQGGQILTIVRQRTASGSLPKMGRGIGREYPEAVMQGLRFCEGILRYGDMRYMYLLCFPYQ